MFSDICYVCGYPVHKCTETDLRAKYTFVIGTTLDSDQNLCYICAHLVEKISIFKTTCLNKSSDPGQFYDQKSFQFQTNSVSIYSICQETECIPNSSDPDYKQVAIIEIDKNIRCDSTSDINSITSYFDVKSESNCQENGYESNGSHHCVDNDEYENIEANEQVLDETIHYQKSDIQEPEDCNKVKTKKKKKKKGFEKIILTYEEQKAVLEAQRKEKKYIESVFKCHSCALGFLFKDSYQSHMVRHEESNGQYCCNVCSLRFATQNLKYMHMILHTERYRCNKCGQAIKRTHKKRHTNECWHGCKNAVSCQLCTKVFKDPDALRQHLKRFHATEVMKTYSCNVCGQTFTNQRALRTHMIKHINHRFKCDSCQSTFSSPYTLRRHKKTHTQVDPSYCVTCDRWYKTSRLYKEHLAVSMKHRQNRFECPMCHRACASRRALASHTAAVHSSDRPYVCACGNRYATARALLDHERRCHRAGPKTNCLCHQCGNSYSTKSKLERHLREVCERSDH